MAPGPELVSGPPLLAAARPKLVTLYRAGNLGRQFSGCFSNVYPGDYQVPAHRADGDGADGCRAEQLNWLPGRGGPLFGSLFGADAE